LDRPRLGQMLKRLGNFQETGFISHTLQLPRSLAPGAMGQEVAGGGFHPYPSYPKKLKKAGDPLANIKRSPNGPPQ
jgi:hypothetical protein